MDIPARKRALRRQTVRRILDLDPAERACQEAALADRFDGLPGLSTARTVLLYASAFPEEIAATALVRRSLQAGRRVVLPRVDRASWRLVLVAIDDLDADLLPGTLGIPEPREGLAEVAPTEVDWMLAPGVAFDERGYRLGRGAGHYDRLLPTLRPEVWRVALLLEPQWVDALPTEPHDQRLDALISPARSLILGPSTRL